MCEVYEVCEVCEVCEVYGVMCDGMCVVMGSNIWRPHCERVPAGGK